MWPPPGAAASQSWSYVPAVPYVTVPPGAASYHQPGAAAYHAPPSPSPSSYHHPEQHGAAQANFRQLFAPAHEEDDGSRKRAAARKERAMELLTTERTYVDALQTVVVLFQVPLRSSGIDVATDDIFGNIELIHNLHLELLKTLEARMAEWTPLQVVGDIFVQYAPFFKLYTQYCSGYAGALDTLQALRRSDAAFARFLKTAQEDPIAQNLDINSFLIMPVQRIPRYSLLLEELLKVTPDTHPDHTPLLKAIALVRDVASHVNEGIRASEAQIKVVQLQSSLLGDFEPLVAPHRRFVREGKLLKITPQGSAQREVFLFNDLLVLCNRILTARWFSGAIDLGPVWVKDLSDDTSFLLVGPAETHMLAAASADEKREWMGAINSAIDKLVSRDPKLKSARAEIVLSPSVRSSSKFQAAVESTKAPSRLVWRLSSDRVVPRLSPEDQIIWAAVTEDGRLAELKKLAESDPAVLDGVDECGRSLAHVAASNGCQEVLSFLLRARPGLLQARCQQGSTVLHAACQAGQAAAVGLLLSLGADGNAASTNDGETPLDAACQSGHVPTVQRLLQEPTVAVTGAALRHADSGALKAILQQGGTLERLAPTSLAESGFEGKAGRTLLHCAAEWEWLEAVRYLCHSGLRPVGQDQDGATALHVAAATGNVGVMAELVSALPHAAALNLQDKHGRTALHCAAHSERTGAVSLLVDAHAEVNVVDDGGKAPLHIAFERGRPEMIHVLLTEGRALLTLKDSGGRQPAEYGSEELFIRLFGSVGQWQSLFRVCPAVAQIRDAQSRSPLHWAALWRAPALVQEIVVSLVQLGETTAPLDRDKITPLTIAARNGDVPIASLLLLSGADAGSGDPLFQAARWGRVKVVELLVNHGAPVDGTAADGGDAPLHAAVRAGNEAVVKALLVAGALTTLRDGDQHTVLELAEKHQHWPVYGLLLAQSQRQVDGGSAGERFAQRGYLCFGDSIGDGFQDSALVVDCKKDRALHFCLRRVQSLMGGTMSTKERLLWLAVFVAAQLGGADDDAGIAAGKPAEAGLLCATARGTRRRRAILFKYLADQLELASALVRWLNVIELDGVLFVIDVMHDPAALYEVGSRVARNYAATGNFEKA